MTRQSAPRRSVWRKASAVSVLGLALCAAVAFQAKAGELATKGTFSATFVNEGRSDLMQMDKDKWSWVVFGRIASVSDTGDGLWHNMSGDCLGMGVGDQGSGYCRYADSDGDMIFEHWEESEMGKGVGTLLGGTGKFQGIESVFEYDYAVLPSPEGTLHLAGKKRGSYRLP